MKMQENEDEKELNAFFSEWKENDKNLEIPDFEYKGKAVSWVWKWIPVGIAAVFLLSFWLKTDADTEIQLEKDLLIITLVQDENKEQHFVIETKSSLDEWEAPSSSLLTEF